MEAIKITKAIRFKLEAEKLNNQIQDSVTKINSNSNFNLSDFLTKLDKFMEDMNAYLFYKKKDGTFAVKDNMIIKNEWLKVYAKQELAELKEHSQNSMEIRRVQKTVRDIDCLKYKIESIFDEIDDITALLFDDASAELHERAKRARTALLLKRLLAKKALPCIVSLVENSVDKKEIGNLSLRLKSQGQKLMQQLMLGIQEYLPEQSNGLPIAKASFNYYTINKRPVDYNRIITEISNKLSISLDNNGLKSFARDKVHFSNNLWQHITTDIKAQCKNKQLLLGDSPFADIDKYASLRQILKNIMAKQKAKFQELMQNKSLYETICDDSTLYLFQDISEDEFDEYYEATETIEEIGTDINQCTNDAKKKKLRSDLTTLKKNRGSLIDAADKFTKNKFKTYKEFANLYRIVSQKHGKLLAQLKGIEKERTESQLLNYWALILEENKWHKLVLIPKEKAADCRTRLAASDDNKETVRLYWFESFTFRSLQKLCFGNLDNDTQSNTFYPGIQRELFDKYSTMNRGKYHFITGEFEFKGDEQKKIQFYKDVLSTRYAKQVLNLPLKEIEEKIVKQSFDSLDDFIIALEQICYCRFVTTNKNIIGALDKFDAQIFDITSLDLQNAESSASKENKYVHTDKAHTQLWNYFWTQNNEQKNYDTRLNPEITITYRKPKQSRIEKYGKNSERYDENKKNRYLHEQFTLITTFSEHSNAPAKSLSFVADDEFVDAINGFNKSFNTETVKFALGIDNGEVELSTLGVYLSNFAKPTSAETIAELQKVKDYGFKVLTITNLSYSEKDMNGKDRRIIQNPSYFLNKELYCRTFGKNEAQYEEMYKQLFAEKYLLTLDLTTAKVIGGQIISNGDVPSLFNLWMRHAQRTIYAMNDHSDKETAKNITLKKSSELADNEKRKFIDYLNKDNGKYAKLSDDEKVQYMKWIYDFWNDNLSENSKFEEVRKGQRVGNYSQFVLFAVCYIGKDLQNVTDIFDVRNIFKLRQDFYALKTETEIYAEIEKYNVRTISDEELDLKFNQLKQSLVANVVGVVDLLYKQYKTRLGGDGIIVKEGFDSKKVDEDREKFSGNIYRILERKLYQKFQNYGLVPPIKNLMLVRTEGVKNNGFMQLGNICFVDPEGTSQNCPVCGTRIGGHAENMKCECGFNSENIMHSNDGVAGFNIAKRGFENQQQLIK